MSKEWIAGLRENDVCFSVAYDEWERYKGCKLYVKLPEKMDVIGKVYNREKSAETNPVFENAPPTPMEETEQEITDLDIRLTKLEGLDRDLAEYSKKYEWIKKRYLKGYITEEQLDKYVELGVITKEEAAEIRRSKK